jgi:hypothetical protein
VRNQQGDIRRSEAVTLQQHLHAFDHLGHGKLEHHLAVLFEEVLTPGDRLHAGRMQRPAGRHEQVVSSAAIHPVMKVQDPERRLRRFQQHRTRAVAKENRRSAVQWIDDRAHEIRTDHNHPLMRAAGDQLGARRECVEEAGTGGRKIEAPGPGEVELILNETGGCGKEHVGGDGRHDDSVDVPRSELATGHEPANGFGAHRGGRLARSSDSALADAGAGDDPLVRGIETLRQLRVGQYSLRHVDGNAGDRGSAGLEVPFYHVRISA